MNPSKQPDRIQLTREALRFLSGEADTQKNLGGYHPEFHPPEYDPTLYANLEPLDGSRQEIEGNIRSKINVWWLGAAASLVLALSAGIYSILRMEPNDGGTSVANLLYNKNLRLKAGQSARLRNLEILAARESLLQVGFGSNRFILKIDGGVGSLRWSKSEIKSRPIVWIGDRGFIPLGTAVDFQVAGQTARVQVTSGKLLVVHADRNKSDERLIAGQSVRFKINSTPESRRSAWLEKATGVLGNQDRLGGKRGAKAGNSKLSGGLAALKNQVYTIKLKNGDRLTGKIVKRTAKSLQVQTGAGQLVIPIGDLAGEPLPQNSK